MSERKETHKMQKKWNEYQIIDTRQLINKLPEDEREQYKHKVLFKNKCLTDDVMMFTKSDFKKYRENNDAYIVGKINKQQKHYNNSLDSFFMLYLIYLFDNEVYL